MKTHLTAEQRALLERALWVSENTVECQLDLHQQGLPRVEFARDVLGQESDDFETRNDEARLQLYVQQLYEQGLTATSQLGFRNRAEEIVRIIKESKADMLVIGAHRHSGIKDWLYGETINSVRHELKIPILVVNL